MRFLIVFLFLFSFNSNAAICVYESGNTTIRNDQVEVENCNDYILLTKADYEAINIDSIVATLKELFEFSIEDFAYFNAICLIGFLGGHALGRVSRILGKV